MRDPVDYAELHCHSNFSFLDGASHPEELVAEGIIYRVAGRGTYPTVERDRYIRQLGSVEDLLALSYDTECELLVPLDYRVDVESASLLRIPSDEVMSLTLRRLHRDVPFCVTTVTTPPRVGVTVADNPELTVKGTRSQVTVIGLLDVRLPRPITAYRTRGQLLRPAALLIQRQPSPPPGVARDGLEQPGPTLNGRKMRPQQRAPTQRQRLKSAAATPVPLS